MADGHPSQLHGVGMQTPRMELDQQSNRNPGINYFRQVHAMNARLHHNGRSQGCVGIDIGGTKIEGVLLDATDRVIDVCRMPSHSGESNVVTDIVRVAHILSNEALPIGIGIPGQVNCATGQVRNVVNLDIETLELGERVSAIMHAPVHVENDVNAAAVGAAEFVEQVDGNATVVFLNFGTGLAAGLVRGADKPNTGTADPSAKSGTYPSTPTDSNAHAGSVDAWKPWHPAGPWQNFGPPQTRPCLISSAKRGKETGMPTTCSPCGPRHGRHHPNRRASLRSATHHHWRRHGENR